jgi:hypothetical protein
MAGVTTVSVNDSCAQNECNLLYLSTTFIYIIGVIIIQCTIQQTEM